MNSTQKIIFFYLFLAFTTFGCNDASELDASLEQENELGSKAFGGAADAAILQAGSGRSPGSRVSSKITVDEDLIDISDASSATAGRKISYSADIQIEVENYLESAKVVEEGILKMGGYIADSQSFMRDDGTREGIIRAHLPSESFELFITFTEKVGQKILAISKSAEDVTENYVDVEMRIESKKELLGRYRKLLLKASEIDDLIRIEQTIERVTFELERLERRRKNLDKRIEYSVVMIDMSEPKLEITKETVSFTENLVNAIQEGFVSLQNRIANLVYWAVAISPFILLGLVVFFALRRKRSN